MKARTAGKPPTTTPQAVPTPRTCTAAKSAPLTPSDEEIRRRAYEIFLARNGGPGDALDDWIRAERELRAETGTAQQ
jgi:hypothetical protein